MQAEPVSEYARLLRSRFARVEGQEIAGDVLEELCSILAMEHGVEASISYDLEHVANVYALGKARSQGERRPSEEKRVLLQIAKNAAIVAKLWDEAVDLRIRAPDGTIVHARRFLKAAAYAPVPIRVLRKRDETAFLILPDSGSAFAAGSYRLDITYLRHNPADLDSPILTQSGDSSPERAILDFAWNPFA